MKNILFRFLITPLLTFLLPLQNAAAQGNSPEVYPCEFIQVNPNQPNPPCLYIRYISVLPAVNTSGQNVYRVRLEVFATPGTAGCGNINRITITPVMGAAVVIRDFEGTTRIEEFDVNPNAFNNNQLRIIVSYRGSSNTLVFDLQFNPNPDGSCNLDPLPVELIDFTGLPTQSGISLNWSTEIGRAHV